MDPLLFSLPEIILNDSEEPDCPQSGSLSSSYFFPQYHQPVSASQEELDTHKLPKPFLQTIHELVSRVGPFRPSEPHLAAGEPVSPSSSRVAQMLQRRANPHQKADTLSWTQMESNRKCVQHLIPSLMGPFQTQSQDCPPFLNVLPGVCPPSLNLQTSPQGDGSQPGLAPLFPELVLAPCCPHDSRWPSVSPVANAPNSNFGFGPHMLVPVSSPPEFCCGPGSPPRSWLLLPEVRPKWCTCPRAVHVHQPRSQDPFSGGTAQQVSEQLDVTSGSEQLEEQANAEEEEQKSNALKGSKSEVSAGSLPSLGEDSLAELAFEEYMTIMDTMCPEENANEEGEEEKLQIADGSFLMYLNELCSDEDFVRQVESTLNTDYLDSLLSSDPEPIDLLSLEEQEQEVTLQDHQPSADAILNPVTDGTSQVESTLNTEYLDPPLASDPDPIDLLSMKELLQGIMDVVQEQLANLYAANSDSVTPVNEETPTLKSRVEETAPLQNAQAPVWDPPGSQLNANISPDTGPSTALEARDNALVETPAATKSEEASMSVSNLGDTLSAQAYQKPQEGPLPGDPPGSESPTTSSVSWPYEDPRTVAVKDPAASFRAGLSAGPSAPSVPALKRHPHPPPPIREPSEPCGPKDINSNSCPEAIPVPSNADSASSELGAGQRGGTERKEVGKAATQRRGRQLFKREESHFEKRERASKTANTAEQFSEIGERERHRKLAEEMQKLKVEQREGNDPEVSKIPQEVQIQISSFARRTRSTTTEEREQQTPPPASKGRGDIKHSEGKRNSSSKIEIEDDDPASSPMKRSRNRKDKEESKEEVNNAKTDEDEVSLTESSPQSPEVQTKESPGEEPLVQERESPSVKRREIKTSLNLALSPESQTETCDFYSLRSQNVSKRTEGTQQASNPAGVEDEGERRNGDEAELQSPMKRHRHEETETIISSPTKRGRWKSRAERPGDTFEAETSGCNSSPPSTRSAVKAKDGKTSDASAGQQALKGDTIGGRSPRFSRRRQTRLSTKYKNFISCKKNTRNRPLEEGKVRKGKKTLRSGRKIDS